MKTTTDSKFTKRAIAGIAIMAVGLFASSAPRLGAVPSPAQHEMSGTVQRIDRNGAFTSIGALHSGDHVVIRCSHPIFGSKPLLYHVAWQASSTRKGK
jgi:hypothetical protein